MVKPFVRGLRTLACLSVFLLCGAWAATGHKVIGQIAYDHLTPKAKAAVDDLLDGSSLAEFSVWPDLIKNEPAWAWTKPWHFADMPVGETEFKMDRDCPAEGCVVRGVLRYDAVLRNSIADREQRVHALKFLAHYVGDVHQPLHVGHKEDRGGNNIQVRFFSRNTNLHAVWDSSLIARRGMGYEVYAKKLEESLTPERERAAIEVMDPCVWASESHRLAEERAYKAADGDPIKSGDTLGEQYAQVNTSIVDEQLTKAGLRLAAMLNRIYDPPAATPATAAPAETTPAAPQQPAPAVDPIPAPSPDPASNGGVKFVGSRRSKVYHYPTCRDARDIAPGNLMEYTEAPEGKTLHEECPR